MNAAEIRALLDHHNIKRVKLGAFDIDSTLRGKYVNSPEGELFHKSHVLYGLHLARGAVTKEDRALVVEGYMDVVALAQHGVEYAVATLGTATTPVHVQKLFRLTETVVFCFDGDAAGRGRDRAVEQLICQRRADAHPHARDDLARDRRLPIALRRVARRRVA